MSDPMKNKDRDEKHRRWREMEDNLAGADPIAESD